MTGIDVSVVIVNYNSGAYTANLVEGLRRERVSREDGSPGRLEILVVENDSPDDQERWLAPLEQGGVTVLRPGANLGYGTGCNLGARHARGRNLLFMNPDVFVVPGALDHLSRFLDRHPEAGQVGPRGWFDAHRWFHLPRIELPTLSLHLWEAWRMGSRRRAAAFARHRSHHALRIWSARAPQEEPVLAGYAFMMPARVARELGPFDEDYPLYFEDSDLTRRVRGAGYRCLLVPEAEMVHLYNKSAGQFEAEALAKMATSQRLYHRKHYGRLGAWIAEHGGRWLARRHQGRRSHEFTAPVDLGACAEPPVFPVSGGRPYVLELTLDPLFTLAVGHLDEAPELVMPEGVWEHLDPTRFFVRALSLPDLEPCGAWTFHKTAAWKPVRSHQDFLDRLEGSAAPRELVA